jgi:hypothetical protein
MLRGPASKSFDAWREPSKSNRRALGIEFHTPVEIVSGRLGIGFAKDVCLQTHDRIQSSDTARMRTHVDHHQNGSPLKYTMVRTWKRAGSRLDCEWLFAAGGCSSAGALAKAGGGGGNRTRVRRTSANRDYMRIRSVKFRGRRVRIGGDETPLAL